MVDLRLRALGCMQAHMYTYAHKISNTDENFKTLLEKRIAFISACKCLAIV